jgi:hypothetical protein
VRHRDSSFCSLPFDDGLNGDHARYLRGQRDTLATEYDKAAATEPAEQHLGVIARSDAQFREPQSLRSTTAHTRHNNTCPNWAVN